MVVNQVWKRSNTSKSIKIIASIRLLSLRTQILNLNRKQNHIVAVIYNYISADLHFWYTLFNNEKDFNDL